MAEVAEVSDAMPPEGPPNKKAKTDESNGPSTSDTIPGVISTALLSDTSRQSLRNQYRNAQPYTHCVLKDVCNPELLLQVRDEIIHNINATYKETDLFKVFQTGDLGNLDQLDPEAAAKLPSLRALKAALYSPEFRDFVTEITGCGDLSSRTDCSCNVYAQGGHLLCHDDVIGTRCVSYIIYLTDPEDPWTAEDGGALELYPLVEGEKHTPAVTPSTSHLPIFNTMAMFTVLPGQSFHAIQEVYTGDKPRMSISGWYHAEAPPQGSDKASLQQLQAGEDAIKTYTPFQATPAEEGTSTSGDLSDDDLAHLIRFINPVYLSDSSWPKVQARFKEEGSIQLQNFLKKGLAEKLVAAAMAEDKRDELGNGARPQHGAGVRDGWEAVGPPHKQRYLRFNGPVASSSAEKRCGPLMAQVSRELLQSPAFARLLQKLTTITLLGHQAEVRRFRPGLDYTVAHYGILTKDPRLDVVLSFVNDLTPEAAAAWEAGEVGGFEAYLLADEEEKADGAGAAEVYRQDAEESGVLNVSAASNSLNLVLRDEGLMRFVKFVSCAAPGSRWDIAAEYLPEEDSDSEEGDGAADVDGEAANGDVGQQ